MGRFDFRFEQANIDEGMRVDLQQDWGQSVLWYVWDKELKAADADHTYDVGGVATGRTWRSPFLVPCLSVQRHEGTEEYDAGFYTSDSAHVAISVDQALRAGLRHIVNDPITQLKDRFVYGGKVFNVLSLELRGMVGTGYTVIGLDARQINPEELVNDGDFAKYADPGSG